TTLDHHLGALLQGGIRQARRRHPLASDLFLQRDDLVAVDAGLDQPDRLHRIVPPRPEPTGSHGAASIRTAAYPTCRRIASELRTLQRSGRAPHPSLCRCSDGPPCSWARFRAVFTRQTWENAWGKLPSCLLATGSYSSASRPTSLRMSRRRS